jgi:hypothetical protein
MRGFWSQPEAWFILPDFDENGKLNSAGKFCLIRLNQELGNTSA